MKYGTGTCRPGLKKKTNESWAAGQRCVNVTARYEPEALWHEARCSIVSYYVNDNENEKITKTKKKKKKNVRATPGLVGPKLLLFCWLLASRHLDVLINRNIPGLE